MRTNMELQNFTQHLDVFFTALGGLGGSIISYIQGKKNAKSTELDNIEKAIIIYKDAADYLKNDLEQMKGEMEILKKNHVECEESKRRLEIKVDELDRKVCNIGKH